MKKTALLAQWAGDFDNAQVEYDRLFTESLERGDPVEARLLLGPRVRCRLVSSVERRKEQPLEVRRDLVKEMTRTIEAQIREKFASESEPDLKRMIQDVGKEMRQAERAPRPYTYEDENRAEQDRAGLPLRLQSGERRIIVFSIPGGLETRSYHRGDITVDLQATRDQLIAIGGVSVTTHTDRMLEVQFKSSDEIDEVLEIFVDGRIRCISEPQDPTRIANLVKEIAGKLVLQ